MGCYEPSGYMRRGFVPVVLATVRKPPARMHAAINRVTEDFPRVPLTWMRIGMPCKYRRWECASSAKYAVRAAISAPMTHILNYPLRPVGFPWPVAPGDSDPKSRVRHIFAPVTDTEERIDWQCCSRGTPHSQPSPRQVHPWRHWRPRRRAHVGSRHQQPKQLLETRR